MGSIRLWTRCIDGVLDYSSLPDMRQSTVKRTPGVLHVLMDHAIGQAVTSTDESSRPIQMVSMRSVVARGTAEGWLPGKSISDSCEWSPQTEVVKAST